jgi:predicted membrane-bound mannosyltransferase
MSLPSAAAEPGSGAALPGSDPEAVPLGQRLREALPVFVIALLWRASCLMGYLTDPAALTLRFDERSYHALGMRLARGDLLLDPEPLVLSPLYTACVGAVYATFGFEPSAVLWLQMLLGASMVGGVYLLARRLASRGAATFAALLYAFTGPAVFYEHFLLPDLVTAATVLGTLRAWWMMRERGRTRDAVGAGLWLGVATLARPNAALLLPLLAWDAARSAPVGTSAARDRKSVV